MSGPRLAIARTRPGRCPVCDVQMVSPLGRMCPNGCAHLVAASAAPDPLLGRRLERGPILVDLLGQSRSGRIYEALDGDTGQRLAVKVLRPTVGALDQLLQQARQIGEIGHPTIVGPLFTGSEGRLGIVATEFVDGTDLETLHRLDPLTWVHVFMELLAGLGTAANQGYLHLHLSPGKVRLQALPDGRWLPRIADFGLDEVPRARWQVMGVLTPARLRFMAPELDRAGADARADVFGAGALLEWVARGARGDAEVPAGLAQIIARATQPHPGNRYEDAWAMRTALEALARTPALVWNTTQDEALGHDTVQIDCEHCLWALHTEGPAFSAATERLVGALAAEGRLGTHHVVDFRETLSRSGVRLCEAPERPPHVAIECTRCGAIQSVQLKAIDALRYCGSCGARLPPTRLEQQVKQASLPCRPSVFDPGTGTITLRQEMLTVELIAGDVVLPCVSDVTTIWTTDDGPRPAIRVTPTTGTALPAGYLRWVPADAPVIKGLAISHLVDVGHRTRLPPPIPTTDDTTAYVLRFEGRGQQRELRRVYLRRLPPIHVHVAWNGEVRSAGPQGLLMVPRATQITIRLILQGAAPPLETATMHLRWGDNAIPIALNVTAPTPTTETIEDTHTYTAQGVIPGGLPPGLRVFAELSVLFADSLVPFRWTDTWCIATGEASAEGEPWLRVTVGEATPALLHEGLPTHVSTAVDLLGRARFELSAEGIPEEARVGLRSARTGDLVPLVRTTPPDRGQGRWTGQVRVSGHSAAQFEVVIQEAHFDRLYPVTLHAPPSLEYEVVWKGGGARPVRGRLDPSTPIADVGAWPGTQEAELVVRAHHQPARVRIRVVRETLQGSAGYFAGEHSLTREDPWRQTMPLGAEVQLLVMSDDAPLTTFCIRLQRPLDDSHPLRLVGGEAVVVETVTAGLVETRSLELANGRREPLVIVEARSEGIPWIRLEHRADHGGGGISVERPARVPPAGRVELALRIQFPADAPDSRRAHHATLILSVLGVSEPLRLPVRVDRLMGVMPLSGPLALDLGSARVAARLHTPQGVQTWYGNMETGPRKTSTNRAMRAIAGRLGRELRQYAEMVEIVAPTGADEAECAQRAAWVSENFVNARTHCRLDHATAAALGALAELVQRAPLPDDSELVTVDLGASSIDIASIRATRGSDGRWQTWVTSRMYSPHAGASLDTAIAREILRVAIDTLLTGGEEGSVEAGWFARAHSQTGGSPTEGEADTAGASLPQTWHARARQTTGGRRLAIADAWPEEDLVKASDDALLTLARRAKHALGENTEISLSELADAADLIDQLIIDSPWGLVPLNLRACGAVGSIIVERSAVVEVVGASLEPILRQASARMEGNPLAALVGCGLGVRAPGVKEVLERVFRGVPLRLFPRALAVRGAYWYGSKAVTVQWKSPPERLLSKSE